MRQINVCKWFCYNLRLPAYYSYVNILPNNVTLQWYAISIMCIRRPTCYQIIVSWKNIRSDIFPYRLWIELKRNFRVIWYVFLSMWKARLWIKRTKYPIIDFEIRFLLRETVSCETASKGFQSLRENKIYLGACFLIYFSKMLSIILP